MAISRPRLMPMRDRSSSGGGDRIGAICAVAGAGLLFLGTYLHPMGADPNDAIAAFTEYAADHHWVASHLMQLAGLALMIVALLLLGQRLEGRAGKTWARIAAAGAVASLAVAAALQAIDGIALKRTVDVWAAAPPGQQYGAFYAAFAVRQVEIGLASVLSLVLGVTTTLYGVALLVDETYPAWVAALGIIGGVPTIVAGVLIAHTGFSGVAMTLNMPASALLMLWMVALAAYLWRTEGNAHARATESRGAE
jgi:hypothetical protein